MQEIQKIMIWQAAGTPGSKLMEYSEIGFTDNQDA